MKTCNNYLFSIFIALILVSMTILLSGCSLSNQPIGNEKTSVKDVLQEKIDASQDSMGEAMAALDGISDLIGEEALDSLLEGGGLLNKGWPEGKISAEIPEYTKGEVVNSGGTEGDYTILVETTEEELEEYLDQLEGLSWYVTRGSNLFAKHNEIELYFQFNTDTLLQISVRERKSGSWPSDELPAEVFPPDKGRLVGEIEITDIGDEDHQAYYFSYDYADLSYDEAQEYMQQLMHKGWQGDEYMVSKIVDWKGRKFDASIEVQEYEGLMFFTCNLYEQN